MFTIEPLDEWAARQTFEQIEETCGECSGTGECECCGRGCLTCDGTGTLGMEDIRSHEVEKRYFEEVIGILKQVCSFTHRHDFLEEAGHFIKYHGRPGRMRSARIH